MKTKQLILTTDGNPNSIYIAAVPGQDRDGRTGFIVYGFKANKPEPENVENGTLLINTLFATESEALKAGEKIVKAKIKADLASIKKEKADWIKQNKRKKK